MGASTADHETVMEDCISPSRHAGSPVRNQTLIEVREPAAWQETLRTLSRPHVLQTWEWGEFKSRWGWRALRLRWEGPAGVPVAAASVLERRLGRWPLRMWYVPKGPMLEWGNPRLVAEVLDDLEALARRRRALALKIDPDLFHAAEPICGGDQTHAADVESFLRLRGWRFSSEQVQFRNAALVSLVPSEEELLAAMKPKTRYNVRLAERRDVSVRQGTRADLDTFYLMYSETAQRDGFLIRTPAYYLDVWNTFMACGLADLLLAEVDKEPIAGLMLFRLGSTAWYLYGASADRHRNRMPNHLLQWEAMRTARSAGCTCYDMWGAPDHLTEDDPLWGVWRFKSGFGASWVRGLGAWDYAPYRRGYGIYAWLLPRYVGLMRKRHRGSA